MIHRDIVLFPIHFDLLPCIVLLYFLGLLGLLATLILLGFSIYKQIKRKQYYPYLTSLLCVGVILLFAINSYSLALYLHFRHCVVDIMCYYIIVYFVISCLCIYFSYRNRDKHIAYFLPSIYWISVWTTFTCGEFMAGV